MALCLRRHKVKRENQRFTLLTVTTSQRDLHPQGLGASNTFKAIICAIKIASSESTIAMPNAVHSHRLTHK